MHKNEYIELCSYDPLNSTFGGWSNKKGVGGGGHHFGAMDGAKILLGT